MNDNLPIIISVAQIAFKAFMYVTFRIFVFNKNDSPGRIVTKHTHTYIYIDIHTNIYILIYMQREREREKERERVNR